MMMPPLKINTGINIFLYYHIDCRIGTFLFKFIGDLDYLKTEIIIKTHVFKKISAGDSGILNTFVFTLALYYR